MTRRPKHKHKLRFKWTSRGGKTMIFVCKECGRVRGYKRSRVHELALGIGKPYNRFFDRTN